jgi:hypothetical protein
MSTMHVVETPAPFEIAATEVEGGIIASNGTSSMALLDVGGRMFRRRAAMVTSGRTVEWAVAELDGVRVYFDGVKVVVTRRDIYPT